MRILASTSEQQQCSLRNLPLNDDEGVLRGLAGLSQLQLNITPIGPLIKRLAGELGGCGSPSGSRATVPSRPAPV